MRRALLLFLCFGLSGIAAAATPPHGIASGKFQGETTTATPWPVAAMPESSWKNSAAWT